MASDYLIVSKRILPDYLEQVIKARDYLSQRQASSVTEAAKMAGISRSTFYKYKDFVYTPDETRYQRRANMSLVLSHETGSLSAVLTALSKAGISIITISQSIPLAHTASVTMSLDLTASRLTADELILLLKKIPQAISVHLDAME
ncbi:MAG: ACT domain-containing protein [Erysipelotrichia bacterium]|nr:ACT domain-containing protein [Erysipelotrichia bacterium]